MYITATTLVSSSNTPVPKSSSLARKQNKDYNSLIKSLAKLKNDHAILSTYSELESRGLPASPTSLSLVFKACARLNEVERGRRIHDSLRGGGGFMRDVRVGTAVVDFYCKCGFVGYARRVFDEMVERDLVLWNAMIHGCVGCGFYEEAIGLSRMMGKEGFMPNSRTLVALLMACEGVLELRLGKEIHGFCLRNGMFEMFPHVGTALIRFYLNFDLRGSRLVFDLMVSKSLITWNVMIGGYFEYGWCLDALELYVQLLEDGAEFDLVTVLVAIQACGGFGSCQLGMQIHQMACKFGYTSDLFIVNALLNMYSEVGALESTRHLFDSVIMCDVALWNSMLGAYVEHGYYEEAISLFSKVRMEMLENERTIVLMLSLCAELTEGLKLGKALHAHGCKRGIKMDLLVGNSLLTMYSELNSVEDALRNFGEMNDVDVISYNTLILAFSSNDLSAEAWKLFKQMQEYEVQPNSHTIISLLSSCRSETWLIIGQSLHGFVIKCNIGQDISLDTALTEMYMMCGDEETARNLFEACSERDLVFWNSMLACYVKKNQMNEALVLFCRMISEVEPNPVTIINVLSACSDLSDQHHGQCLHGYATRRFSPLGSNLSLANALITMNSRCGSMKKAEEIFKNLPRRNVISWNVMVTGYANHGCSHEAILAFNLMLEDGIKPNGVTFLSLLSACRHNGLVEEGLQFFYSMVQDFDVNPSLSHYGCVVDLLCRGGCLNEAIEFINSMPIEPDASIWRALLSACRYHSSIDLATAIFKKLTEVEPSNSGNYVLISNIYAAAGLWSDVRKVRTWLKEKGLQKPPGTSWIVIKGQTYSFTAGDTSHPQSNTIYLNLHSLMALISEYGYVSSFLSVLHEED